MELKKFILIEQIKHDMTSEAVAKKCGWYPQAYSIRLNNGNMKIADIEKIADAMNCDLKIEFVDRK